MAAAHYSQMAAAALLVLFGALFSPLLALPVLPEPDPALIQPALVFPATAVAGAGRPVTIPAFPEQSDAASACPVEISDELLRGVAHACSSSSTSFSPSRCCPALAAWLYAAYAPAALSAASSPAAEAKGPYDLPVPPDDSEACVDGAEAAIRARGVELPRVNGTCGTTYCYCGVRLRRLSCGVGGEFVAEEGRWTPKASLKSRLQRDCARPGLDGCTRCLGSLNQLNGGEKEGGNVTGSTRRGEGDGEWHRDCQLMGLTWLLSQNRTLYLPSATAVLRAFMAAGDGGRAVVTCSLPRDDMPLAVDYAQISNHGLASAAAPSPPPLLLIIVPLVLLASLF